MYIQHNISENVLCKMPFVLLRHPCVNDTLLTQWGRVTHICVSKLTIIASGNGLSPDRRQAIIWTNAGILLIGPVGINCSEILIEILTFSFKKMRMKVWSAKRRPFCLGLNVLISVLIAIIQYCFITDFLSSMISSHVSVSPVMILRVDVPVAAGRLDHDIQVFWESILP